jgi:hypothetical protein
LIWPGGLPGWARAGASARGCKFTRGLAVSA